MFFVAAFVAVDVEAAAKKDVVTKQAILQLDCAFSGFPGFRVSGPCRRNDLLGYSIANASSSRVIGSMSLGYLASTSFGL